MGIKEISAQLPVAHLNEKVEIKKVQHGNSSKDSISSCDDLYALDVKIFLKDPVKHKQQTYTQTQTCNSTCSGCVQTDSGCYQTQQTCTNNC